MSRRRGWKEGGQDLLHLQLLKIAWEARSTHQTEPATSTRNAFPNRPDLQCFPILFSSLQQVTPISWRNLYNSPFSENLHGVLRIKAKARRVSLTWASFRLKCVYYITRERAGGWRCFPCTWGFQARGKMSGKWSKWKAEAPVVFTPWRTHALCFLLWLPPSALWLFGLGPALGSQVGLMLLGPPSTDDVFLLGSVMARGALVGMSVLGLALSFFNTLVKGMDWLWFCGCW